MMKSDPSPIGNTLVLPPDEEEPGEPPSQDLVKRLLRESLILAEDWDALPPRVQARVVAARDDEQAREQLIKHGLLTPYQAARVAAGNTFGLVLGNYRVLERLAVGGMAVVFKAEHMDLRHHVAVKVLPPSTPEDSALESRFFAEMRIVARLRHPNIVAATDAGRAVGPDGSTVLRYLVMEHVPGRTLEDVVREHGPMSPARACAIAYQVAAALGETHKYGLVHRDIKPSNVMLAGEDQAKLLDFGLTRHFGHRLTVPGTVLGTIDYMAPEQARDASTVDIRADVFGLGGTLYWCLTGRSPFPFDGNPVEALTRRLNAPPPSVRDVEPDLPPELEAIVAKMMALHPEDRYPDPAAVTQALLPFVRTGTGDYQHLSALPSVIADDSLAFETSSRVLQLPEPEPSPDEFRVLVIDDDPAVRDLCRQLLEGEGAAVEAAADGAAGLALAAGNRFDLVLLDAALPGMTGVEVLHGLRQSDGDPNLKVLMFSGHVTPEEMSDLVNRGADDFLTKPFSVAQLAARVQNLLRLKAAQDKAGRLNRRLTEAAAGPDFELGGHAGDAEAARDALVLAVARLIDQREGRGTGHPVRMQHYCRTLAEAAAAHPAFGGLIDCALVDLLEWCAPLHDLGRIGLPEQILTKAGPLTQEERATMETHTTTAADALRAVSPQTGTGPAFLHMAIDVIRHHHERHDGTGYPDRLAGEAIPLSARLVAVADTYDSLRSRRPYKPELPHAAAVQIITQTSPGQFDPAVLEVFQQVAGQFETIFKEVTD
jgi:response regulator RpfG family c-di-GMP phosphodiesterase/serine/threonine protein kinase